MNEIIESLTRALDAAPGDTALRTHLAGLLLAQGRRDEAVSHLARVLGERPGDADAAALMAQALGAQAPVSPPASPAAPTGDLHRPVSPTAPAEPTAPNGELPLPETPELGQAASAATTDGGHFDWHAAESQVGDIAEPMFVGEGGPEPTVSAWDVERSDLRLADVGGMAEVKERLEVSFLAPLRNPELRRMYGKALRGGLLLYGPPGCGKTFIARAVAGEMGASFISVGLADVLDMWIGSSEKNIHELFRMARDRAPVVLFLDELDALGQSRSMTRHSGMRGTVNQLLTELDGVDSANEGVFVLAATNQPWDLDPALRRPGRLDRTLLVLPPDAPAREAIFRHHLKTRPVSGIDPGRLAKRTEGYSGADLAHICETAAERAMIDSVRSGQVRMITMADLEGAIGEVRPSVDRWFDTARNVVTFSDSDGTYAELRQYMKRTRRL